MNLFLTGKQTVFEKNDATVLQIRDSMVPIPFPLSQPSSSSRLPYSKNNWEKTNGIRY
jgi:hypothetical protein